MTEVAAISGSFLTIMCIPQRPGLLRQFPVYEVAVYLWSNTITIRDQHVYAYHRLKESSL